jgi:hypothetical protein
MKTLALGVILVLTAVLAPVARADKLVGNYELAIANRYDFHTWVWAIRPCQPSSSLTAVGGCVHVSAVARPVAKAFDYQGDAPLADGRYTLTVDVPDGLRCGDVYYGPTIPTHDVYAWDATALTGALQSSFETGCNGAAAGTYTYPFTLTRM